MARRVRYDTWVLGKVPEALVLAQEWLAQATADLVLVVAHDRVGSCGVVAAPVQAAASADIYAVIESVTVGTIDQGPDVYRQGLEMARVTPADVGLLHVCSWPPSADVATGYVTGSGDLTCAVGTTLVEPVSAGSRQGECRRPVATLGRHQDGALSSQASDPTDRAGLFVVAGLYGTRCSRV